MNAPWHAEMATWEPVEAQQPSIADEFTGRRKAWSWAAATVVGALFWTAVFAWWLA